MIPQAVHGAVLLSAFLIIFFLSLFCLFPIGLGEVDPETGAPLKPRLGLKVLVAAAIAVVLWIIFYILVATGVLNL